MLAGLVKDQFSLPLSSSVASGFLMKAALIRVPRRRVHESKVWTKIEQLLLPLLMIDLWPNY